MAAPRFVRTGLRRSWLSAAAMFSFREISLLGFLPRDPRQSSSHSLHLRFFFFFSLWLRPLSADRCQEMRNFGGSWFLFFFSFWVWARLARSAGSPDSLHQVEWRAVFDIISFFLRCNVPGPFFPTFLLWVSEVISNSHYSITQASFPLPAYERSLACSPLPPQGLRAFGLQPGY